MEASSVGWRGGGGDVHAQVVSGRLDVSELQVAESTGPGSCAEGGCRWVGPDPARTARKNVAERRTDEDELRIVEGVFKGSAAAGSAIWRATWPALSRAVAVICGGWDRIQASLSDSAGWMARVSWVGRPGRRLRSTP